MPLKIRCPHCKRVLTVENDAAGRGKYCPACGLGFTVPIPVGDAEHAREVAQRCEKCGAGIAPGTRHCPKCYHDPATGRRLPLRQRLRYVKTRRWAWLGGLALAALIVALLAVRMYDNHFRRRPTVGVPVATRSEPGVEPSLEWSRKLLSAADADERRRALDGLRTATHERLSVLAQALEEERANPRARTRTDPENLAAALNCLAQGGDARHLPLIRSFQERPELRDVVLLARGRLGDAAALDDLVCLWEQRLRREIFIRGLSATLPADLARTVQIRERVAVEEVADALRRLGDLPGSALVDRSLADYWESWCWLGQKQGELFSAGVFRLAQPYSENRSDFKDAIRAARDRLGQAADRANPATRAAAALVLAENAPQYQSLRDRMTAAVAGALPDAPPADRQRIAWTLARLSGQSFGGLKNSDPPLRYAATAMRDALRWAGRQFGVEVAALETAADAYPEIPRLTRRVVTSRRQLEEELLGRLAHGWPMVSEALDGWRCEGLGVTPRIEDLLNPAQSRPNYPALAGALILAAETGTPALWPRLNLWIAAGDQPAWVRGFAACAAMVIDARNGTYADAWPRGLDEAFVGGSSADAPPIDLWGRLLAPGGSALWDRLARAGGDSPPAAIQSTLLRAARQAAARRPGG